MNNYSIFKSWSVLELSKRYYLFLLCFCSATYAQNHLISGTVSDKSGILPGVTIQVKNKAVAILTDSKGHYLIDAAPNDFLVFSFIGYKTIEIPVQSNTTINVLLQEDATTLKEVIINAGYYSTKDSERTGSIAKVTSKDIDKLPVSNPLAAMQGRMSGVNITQSTSMPGGNFSIQIRGINSIRSEANEPLYIVDGVPFSSQSLGSNALVGGILPANSSPLNSINPTDIESIEVLKDADATAIYGSRGANGVVLITTKKGRTSETKFSIQSAATIGQVAQKMKLLNTSQYLAMRKEAFANDGITTYPTNAYDLNGTWDQNHYTDWQKVLIGGTAHINTLQASVSGGGANTQFLLSGNYRKETTVFPDEANFQRGAFHNTLSHHSTDNKFNLSLTTNYISDKSTLPGQDLTGAAYTLAPNAPALYDSQGNLNWQNGTFSNPLAFLNGSYLTQTNNLIANAQLSYKIGTDFELKTSLGYNSLNLSETRTLPSTIYNPSYNIGPDSSTLYLNDSKTNSWIVEPQLSWNKRTTNWQFNVLLGTTFQNQKSQQLVQSGTGFAGNNLMNNLGAATYKEVINHDFTTYNYTAVFGRLNTIWKDRYILNLTARRDGSSRFGPGNRFANFGAVGAAWLFSKEAIFNDSLLSFGKLRASYGTSGNDQIGDYQFLDTYSITGALYNGVVGISPTRLYNPDFAWETNRKLETALELGFFKNRINLTAAYYRNRSSNQLVGIPFPGTTGFTTLNTNLNATVQNTGFELELSTQNFKTKDFNWTTNFNLSRAKNKLIAFPDLESSTYSNSLVIGQPLQIKKAYEFTGIDPQTGAYTYRDFNNDGLITATDDRKVVKDLTPEYFGGLSNQLSYKNWSMDILFQFVKQQAYNYLLTTTMAGTMSNQPVDVLNHFPDNGTTAEIQQYTTGANATLTQAYYKYYDSNAAISDASFIRLKSANISYSIPTAWAKYCKAKIYLQGQNLLTFTHYKGADPENHSAYFLPPLRQFTLGVQLSF
ncbi:SusC/RagA family protein [Flavobacterium sp. L1I52]|uniref:SusC/RagA family protein n=1 Tax=Flavobacterium pokkalii TaxID=1940408 RepID=A0ABR7UPF8_9FLAO|nr:SusC/RagA family TonB-linked outer membrane protein [Flavobacterium pokkalii]MBD0724771.1 SusC/RagA family protein [Flavobacterium pokkalii]